MFNFQVLKCPVCGAVLGRRLAKEIFKGHCDECRTTFLFSPNDLRPTALLDHDKDKRHCGCGGCGR